MVEHTGAKWNPSIDDLEAEDEHTVLRFKSAWVPTNPLLKRLHALTGWRIHNRFEEEQPEFEGDFHAEAGKCHEEVRPGRPPCLLCDAQTEYDDLNSHGECPSCDLWRDDYLVSLRADVTAYREHTNAEGINTIHGIDGDVVLGIFSARSAEEAYAAAKWRLPEDFWTEQQLEEDPEAFGLKVYKLAKEGG